MATQHKQTRFLGRRLIIISLIICALIFTMIVWILSSLKILPSYFATIIVVLIAVLSIIFTYLQLLFPLSQTEELRPLREERKEINDRLKGKAEEDIIDTIRLGLNQLTEYYVINKNQAKSSFGFSLFAIVVGLLTIIFGIVLFYIQRFQNLQITAIISISGAMLEFIGGAYFFVYRKSIEQMNLYFNQLIKMQDTMLAIKLTKDINDNDRQVDLTEKLILTLLKRSSKISTDLTDSDKKDRKGTSVTETLGKPFNTFK